MPFFLINTLLLYIPLLALTDRRNHRQRKGWRNLFPFPVVLLCQFFVLVENRLWFYILLMYLEYHTVVVLCYFFCSGGKQFQVFRTYSTYCTIQLCGCVSFWFWREIQSFTLHLSLSPYRWRNKITHFAWAGGTFFPVVLLCCVSFGSGGKCRNSLYIIFQLIVLGLSGKQFLGLRTYLVYNTVVRLCQFFCCGGKVNFV